MNVERIKQLKKIAWQHYMLSQKEIEQVGDYLELMPNTSEWQGTAKAEIVALRVSTISEDEFEVFCLFLQAFKEAQASMEKFAEDFNRQTQAKQTQGFQFGIRKTQTVEVYAR